MCASILGQNLAGVIAAVLATTIGKGAVVVEAGAHGGGLSASGLRKTDIGRKEAIDGLAREFYRRLCRH